MHAWRKPSVAAVWLALACTPAAAQYAPLAAPQPQPYATGAAQPYQPGPMLPSASTAYATGVAFASTSEGLKLALEANRRRDLQSVLSYQSRLTDPLARKIVAWAMVDMFGEQLGRDEIERAARELKGWPREDGREAALERVRGSAPATPNGPVPYLALGPGGETEGYSARVFSQKKQAMTDALRAGDMAGAYTAIANHGLPMDANYAEAESFAGWLALNKLRNPTLAEQHFTRLDAAVKSPVSKARAAYWRGKAAEAAGDPARARGYYEQGAQHTTTFYGQLSAERAGMAQLVLTADPVPTPADLASVRDNDVVQAMRMLSQAGERSLVRVFGLHLGDVAPDRTQLAVVMDTIKAMGETELSLLAYRRGAQRGLILHERGYPVRTPPSVMGGAEPAFVLAITRQESQFDPRVRSSADARGMMQLLPGTARDTARKVGMSYEEQMLWDPEYNMRLGSAYLGQVSDRFSGSYIMAAAGYNAGPGRPGQWSTFCGDPRSSSVDPLDFIECIPFSETRNYVMRVMENMQVYRARLNGGTAPLTLSQDLKRGGYGYAGPAGATSGGYRVGGGGR